MTDTGKNLEADKPKDERMELGTEYVTDRGKGFVFKRI